MLSRLKIINFLLIDELELDLNSGLTVVTGETGSGKSIIIDALMIVFGTKVSTEVIRPNQTQASFEAEFTLDNKYAISWLEDNDLLDADNVNNLLCKRVIDRNGKNKLYINGNVVTVKQIKQVGDLILDVHTQHASITLLKQDVQRSLLDEYANISNKVQQIGECYKAIAKIEEQIELVASKNQEDELKRIELQKTYDELSELAIRNGEWDELESSHKQLANAQLILQELDFINNVLDGDENAIKPAINKSIAKVEKLLEVSSKCANLLKLFQAIEVEVVEANYEINRLAGMIEQDPEKLAEVESRINSIFDISRKYRVEPEKLVEYTQEIEKELTDIGYDDDLKKLQHELILLEKQYSQLASEITAARSSSAKVLSQKITGLLHQLAISGEFAIELVNSGVRTSFGLENVEYKVCFNKGLELQSLAKAASGGELSRTALALYLLLSTHNPPEVIIFDEVDTGIGGKVAAIVGKMLQELGQGKQVICITHQPQTASYGDNHLVVNKALNRETAKLSVREVNNDSRVEEIARMLSGIEVTEATRKHAKELLNIK